MRIKKAIVPLCIFLAFILFCSTAHATTGKNIVFTTNSQEYGIDGTSYPMDATPHLEKGRMFVPLRYLGYALGLQDKDIRWDQNDNAVVFNFTTTQIQLILEEQLLYVNGEGRPMDVAPVLIKERVYLPASFIATALGYVSFWDDNTKSICINPSIDWMTKLPEAGMPDPKTPPKTETPDIPELKKPTMEKPLAASEIFFPATKDNNVYNAGIAAKYINGKVLEPGAEFSFNKVVGIRSTGRGFIKGQDVDGNPENGGGVCRTSTVVYQAARKAGFKITERHPHIPPVWYTPVGTDATVVWGAKDLRFINNLNHPVTIMCGLEDKKGGGFRLYVEIHK